MQIVATKIKTAVVTAAFSAALITSFAGGAAAQEANPFVNGQVPNVNTPNVKTPAPERTNPFGTPGARDTRRADPFGNPNARTRPGNRFGNQSSMDSRLKGYLVGTWQGRLSNGQTHRIRFGRDGRVAMAKQGSTFAMVGRYAVIQGQIRFQILARCNISTGQCQRLGQPRSTNVAFRPVNRQTLQVRTGYMRRVG